MGKKIWYEIWGKGPAHDKPVLLVKVRSEGLACLVVSLIEKHFDGEDAREMAW